MFQNNQSGLDSALAALNQFRNETIVDRFSYKCEVSKYMEHTIEKMQSLSLQHYNRTRINIDNNPYTFSPTGYIVPQHQQQQSYAAPLQPTLMVPVELNNSQYMQPYQIASSNFNTIGYPSLSMLPANISEESISSPLNNRHFPTANYSMGDQYLPSTREQFITSAGIQRRLPYQPSLP